MNWRDRLFSNSILLSCMHKYVHGSLGYITTNAYACMCEWNLIHKGICVCVAFERLYEGSVPNLLLN